MTSCHKSVTNLYIERWVKLLLAKINISFIRIASWNCSGQIRRAKARRGSTLADESTGIQFPFRISVPPEQSANFVQLDESPSIRVSQPVLEAECGQRSPVNLAAGIGLIPSQRPPLFGFRAEETRKVGEKVFETHRSVGPSSAGPPPDMLLNLAARIHLLSRARFRWSASAPLWRISRIRCESKLARPGAIRMHLLCILFFLLSPPLFMLFFLFVRHSCSLHGRSRLRLCLNMQR